GQRRLTALDVRTEDESPEVRGGRAVCLPIRRTKHAGVRLALCPLDAGSVRAGSQACSSCEVRRVALFKEVWIEVGQPVVRIVRMRQSFPAEAQVQGQPPSHAPIVQ